MVLLDRVLKCNIFKIHSIKRGDAQRVRLGIVNLKSDSHQEIDIEKRISHPDYASKSKYNDIALLKLIKNVAFNEHVRPACINIDESYDWSLALATGFGRLTYGLSFLWVFLMIDFI